MKAVMEKNKETVRIRADCRADEGRKHVEKVELKTDDVDTVKHVEKKLVDKGVARLERHPADGLPLKHDRKKGRGGKYTWEGPEKELVAEVAVDDEDPNYADEEEDDDEMNEVVVGEVEVAKVAEDGVARIEVHPQLIN